MGKHEDTLAAIYAEPTQANISWRRIESMLVYFGAELSQGRGSRVRVRLSGVKATFHRPHPQHEAHKGLVRSVRRLLVAAGISGG